MLSHLILSTTYDVGFTVHPDGRNTLRLSNIQCHILSKGSIEELTPDLIPKLKVSQTLVVSERHTVLGMLNSPRLVQTICSLDSPQLCLFWGFAVSLSSTAE